MIIQFFALLTASLTWLAWIIRIEIEVLSVWLSFTPMRVRPLVFWDGVAGDQVGGGGLSRVHGRLSTAALSLMLRIHF